MVPEYPKDLTPKKGVNFLVHVHVVQAQGPKCLNNSNFVKIRVGLNIQKTIVYNLNIPITKGETRENVSPQFLF